eukprot:TRINITY_DN587_c0_g1_i1.p1 TRINITY_DN587_c0_g1~~TRINITY_DN587_c0_g1_i1.p1  ORF type:complete len:340 (-),score=84.16 TRINITY_DN587_c0_g1_i1:306-1325(-)
MATSIARYMHRFDYGQTQQGKYFRGKVFQCPHPKTVSVIVARHVTQYPMKRVIMRTKKYMVHDEFEEAGPGDSVIFEHSKSYSKTKHWKITKVWQQHPANKFLDEHEEYRPIQQGTHVQKLRRVRSADGLKTELAPDSHLAIDRLAKGRAREELEKEEEEERIRRLNDPSDWFKDLSFYDNQSLVKELKEATEAIKEFSEPRSKYIVRPVDKIKRQTSDMLEVFQGMRDRSLRYEDLYGMGFTDQDLAEFDMLPTLKKELHRVLRLDPNQERFIDRYRQHNRRIEEDPEFGRDQAAVERVSIDIDARDQLRDASDELEPDDLEDDGGMPPVWRIPREGL